MHNNHLIACDAQFLNPDSAQCVSVRKPRLRVSTRMFYLYLATVAGDSQANSGDFVDVHLKILIYNTCCFWVDVFICLEIILKLASYKVTIQTLLNLFIDISNN